MESKSPYSDFLKIDYENRPKEALSMTKEEWEKREGKRIEMQMHRISLRAGDFGKGGKDLREREYHKHAKSLESAIGKADGKSYKEQMINSLLVNQKHKGRLSFSLDGGIDPKIISSFPGGENIYTEAQKKAQEMRRNGTKSGISYGRNRVDMYLKVSGLKSKDGEVFSQEELPYPLFMELKKDLDAVDRMTLAVNRKLAMERYGEELEKIKPEELGFDQEYLSSLPKEEQESLLFHARAEIGMAMIDEDFRAGIGSGLQMPDYSQLKDQIYEYEGEKFSIAYDLGMAVSGKEIPEEYLDEAMDEAAKVGNHDVNPFERKAREYLRDHEDQIKYSSRMRAERLAYRGVQSASMVSNDGISLLSHMIGRGMQILNTGSQLSR